MINWIIEKIVFILLFIGSALLSGSVLVGLGVALYSWGPLNIELADSLWAGFSWFLYVAGAGAILVVIGFFLGTKNF